MKKILIIALLLIATSNVYGQGLPVPANATLASLFPDENLRRVVAEVLGPNAGLTGQRLSDELAKINKLVAIDKNIDNAEGIEYLIGLIELYLNQNNITNINVSNFINLTGFSISNNKLTHIDISNLINLSWLNVSDNLLTILDISNNIKLEILLIVNSPLEIIDFLSEFRINNNKQVSIFLLDGQ